MMSRRELLVRSAAGGLAMSTLPLGAFAGHLSGGGGGTVAAVNPADFALGTGWVNRWKRFPGNEAPSSVEKTGTGLRLYGPQTIVSKKMLTKTPSQRLRIVFRAVNLSPGPGDDGQQGVQLYCMLEGPGTATRPKNISQWPLATLGEPTGDNIEFHPGVRCYNTNFCTYGGPADWDWRVRLRMFYGDGRKPRIIENVDNPPAPAPGPFVFEPGVAYECVQIIKAQTFKWTQTRIDTGASRTMSVIDARFDDFLSGGIGFRPMFNRAIEISDLNVTVT